MSLARGPVIAAISLIVVVIGANLFDLSYQSVESLLQTRSDIMIGREISPNQFVNFTIQSNQLQEHNVIVVHGTPKSDLVRLNGIEPNGMTFEKESNNGFLYHIIQKDNQGGLYAIQISDLGDKPVKIDVVMGEDPYLGKNCNAPGVKCSVVQMSIGMVAGGIIGFIVGILIGMLDFKKEAKLQKK